MISIADIESLSLFFKISKIEWVLLFLQTKSNSKFIPNELQIISFFFFLAFSFCVDQDREAGDDPDIEDILEACCS